MRREEEEEQGQQQAEEQEQEPSDYARRDVSRRLIQIKAIGGGTGRVRSDSEKAWVGEKRAQTVHGDIGFVGKRWIEGWIERVYASRLSSFPPLGRVGHGCLRMTDTRFYLWICVYGCHGCILCM